jgi:hypothetical protein
MTPQSIQGVCKSCGTFTAISDGLCDLCEQDNNNFERPTDYDGED